MKKLVTNSTLHEQTTAVTRDFSQTNHSIKFNNSNVKNHEAIKILQEIQTENSHRNQELMNLLNQSGISEVFTSRLPQLVELAEQAPELELSNIQPEQPPILPPEIKKVEDLHGRLKQKLDILQKKKDTELNLKLQKRKILENKYLNIVRPTDPKFRSIREENFEEESKLESQNTLSGNHSALKKPSVKAFNSVESKTSGTD